MEEDRKAENHMTSAAAFVEGGIQTACDDSCSICLETFSNEDPSTVTSCKHEFHLQCILEWCQRSSQCPMCWQSFNLKDPNSQELLEAVETERNLRLKRSRTAAIFHHPALADFELQHLPVELNDSELEERIIQHLAAAAAMGRARHIGRREGERGRSHARPHLLVVSSHANSDASNVQSRDNFHSPTPLPGQPTGNPSTPTATQSISANEDGAGPSEFSSFSESLKSRFTAASARYKESISRNTRGWKDKLFSRNSAASISSGVRREFSSGLSTISRIMERLEMRESRAASSTDNNTPSNDALEQNGANDSLHNLNQPSPPPAQSILR